MVYSIEYDVYVLELILFLLVWLSNNYHLSLFYYSLSISSFNWYIIPLSNGYYKLMDRVMANMLTQWNENGIIDKLKAIKYVFSEDRKTKTFDKVFQQFITALDNYGIHCFHFFIV